MRHKDFIEIHHYTAGEVECIDAIRSALGEEGFRAYCRGVAIAYLWRAPHKGAEAEDYRKTGFYVERLVEASR